MIPHFDFAISIGNVLTVLTFAVGFWRAQVNSIAAQNKIHLDGVERINRLETSLIERMARLETWIEVIKSNQRRHDDWQMKVETEHGSK